MLGSLRLKALIDPKFSELAKGAWAIYPFCLAGQSGFTLHGFKDTQHVLGPQSPITKDALPPTYFELVAATLMLADTHNLLSKTLTQDALG